MRKPLETHAAVVGGTDDSSDKLLRSGPVRRVLQFPLYRKIVVANSVFVALAAAGATLLTGAVAHEPVTALALGVLAGSLLVAVTVTALTNAFLVRLALSPLAPLEETARRIEGGDLQARVAPSPLADADMLRLTDVFNAMLDRLAEARQRQMDLGVMALDAEERERTRVARELYDDTAQALATTLLRVRAATRTASEPDDDTLARIRTEIMSALDGIRRIARRLRPPELDELGLTAAVAAHARRVAEVSGLRVDCTTEPVDRLLDPGGRQTLYRILHEALDNAIRHAQAQRIDVRIALEEDWVVASVQDDGKGFDPVAATRAGTGSFGLVGIEERARYLGGRLELESSPGTGTRLRVSVPVRQPATAGPRVAANPAPLSLEGDGSPSEAQPLSPVTPVAERSRTGANGENGNVSGG